MLDGIVTGYEERFDFPARHAPPSCSYLLASLPRAGSTYLSHLLWGSGCLGAPLEYLNFEPAGPYGAAHGDPGQQRILWQQALSNRTAPNGVFGIKCFPGQMHMLQQSNPALVSEVVRFLLGPSSSRKIVQLRRRDRDAHAISYARALLSGIWRKEQEGQDRAEPQYSKVAMERAQLMLIQQEQGWEAMYRDLGIEPLVLWFEDVLSDPAAAVAAVADYLDVVLDPSAAVTVPEISKQSEVGARNWAKEHARK